jgi:hypothetical protein
MYRVDGWPVGRLVGDGTVRIVLGTALGSGLLFCDAVHGLSVLESAMT